VFGGPFFIILNLAVGGNFDGDPRSDAILPATMLVDYVRVYR
jgi:beta-glucanase (GH16 family)